MWQHLDMTEVAVITAEDTVAKDPRVPVSPIPRVILSRVSVSAFPLVAGTSSHTCVK